MTSREIVTAALEHREVPRAPYAISFTVPAREKMAAYYGDPDFGRGWLGDIAVSPVIRVEWGVRDGRGLYVDEFGTEWDRSKDPDIGIPRPSVTPENLDDFVWPDPEEPERFAHLAENIARYPDKFQLMAFDFSLYERAWGLRGLENLLVDFIADPGFVAALLERILEFNLGVIRAGLSNYPQVDAVYFGDDFGTQMGIMMGASRWREILKPRLARQYACVKSFGKKVFIHSCGAVAELFPDFVEIGVDCFNPFQPEVMDIYAVKKKYAGRLAFWGGISTQRLLPYGRVDEVRSEMERLLAMAREGGYIVAPAHAIPGDARPENVAVMLEMLG